MQGLSEYLHVSEQTCEKLLASIAILLFFTLCRLLADYLVRKRIPDIRRIYLWRRTILYLYTLLVLVLIARVWVKGVDSLTTFLGLASAGLAIALHDTIANMAGWLFIVTRKPFKVGDRIQIGDAAGDVIDIRLFQFSMVEIGNWVDADQSTGRIIHVPNNKVLREPLANYEIGFAYIWHEVPVLVTFESDWKQAKQMLQRIADENARHLSEGAQAQIRRAAEKYMIFYDKLTPIVYTTVKDSGVLLTLRYLVNPRERRAAEERIWEAILEAFAREEHINLAYPTTRFYTERPPSS